MKKRIWLLAAACVLLSGCASLLDREYSRVEAHSSKFWESEATGILRAESYQDIVNDLMLLVGRHADQAVIRLYSYDDGVTVADRLEQAAAEVQQETALGSYALEYITSSSTAQRGYYELSVQLGYRRTARQHPFLESFLRFLNTQLTFGFEILLESFHLCLYLLEYFLATK